MRQRKNDRSASQQPPTVLSVSFASCRRALIALALVSGVINILMLTGSIFMMQVYDRVLGSQSIPTLVALSAIAIGAYLFQGSLDMMRGRVLALCGEKIDGDVGPKVHEAVIDLPLRIARGTTEPMQPFRDLDAVRGFMGGPGPAALLDLPWMPLYIVFTMALHPWLGYLTMGGIAVLATLTMLTEVLSRAPMRKAMEAQSARNLQADSAQRGAEVAFAMGFRRRLGALWSKSHETYLVEQRRATFISNGLGAVSRTMRFVLQSATLGLAAYLAIKGHISSGSIIAATILSSRAVAPVDQVIGSWRGFVQARQGFQRLQGLLRNYPDRQENFQLPRPSKELNVDNIQVVAPGGQMVIKSARFKLTAGQAMGVIGRSASGKSSLGRGIIGLWQLQRGRVMLDGASIEQWTPEQIGPAIGYLPQDFQLFEGTVAENISRFAEDSTPEKVMTAAKAVGFHEHVLALPGEQGYNTRVGPSGGHLSTGQRQRLALARALYGDPFLVVLDEPNSNLDGEGDAALTQAIKSIKARNGIVIVIAHRVAALEAVDVALEVQDGETVAFGPRDQILARHQKPAANARTQQAAAQGMKILQGGPNTTNSAAAAMPSANSPKEGE